MSPSLNRLSTVKMERERSSERLLQFLPSSTASYPRHRSSDHDRHLNVKLIIIFCPSATYKRVDRSVSANVLVRRTASVLRVDLESVGRKFFLIVQNMRCCNPTPPSPPFNDYCDCYNSLLGLKNVSMLTNILVFVARPSERGAAMLEERKCNIASAVFAHCIKSMVQIVSMSRSV